LPIIYPYFTPVSGSILIVFKLNATQILVLGYVLVTLVGALLLSLPISSTKGTYQPFIDSLFVATSGISTSGLAVVDIGTYYTVFGQVVLMCIFQIGGIGYMTFFVFIAYLLGQRISIKAGVVARESMATDSYSVQMLGRFFVQVLLYTFLFEFIGAVILALYWMKDFHTLRAIYLGIFHSISAFCTAGFSTFSTSLMNYKSSLTVNLTINIISIIGGLGFFVLIDLFDLARDKIKRAIPAKLTIHSRIALLVTLIVMLAGTTIIFFSETWPATMGISDRILASSFQAISASTTDGFNSINIGAMSAAGLTVLMLLMFIGASPGSTGGGMKTTTLGTLVMAVKSYLQGKRKVNVFEREIPQETIMKAFTVFCLFAAVAAFDLLVLVNIEKATYTQIMFEIISALGNTGLSTGITAGLTFLGKSLLIITMFIGRVGPLTLGAAILAKEKKESLRFPKEDVFVG
jgi:trk system potassium uptake protein TrkH